jgi:RND family efflux transporter MFP subunit
MASHRLKIVLPIVVLIAAIAVAAILAASRKAPPRIERVAQGPLVEVVRVAVSDVPMWVEGHGEVVAKVAVEVVPQVAGQVVEVHPSLVVGGFFDAGEPLVAIDPRDYDLAVERAEAAVARARVSLEREQAEAEVARQEWQALHPDEEPPSGLVVREPQVRQAVAELEAARADLDVARLNLERTRVSVPFAGVVVSKSVDIGQYVAPGRAVAQVYGTDTVEVRVPLEDRELAWFDVPRSSIGDGPAAEVSAVFAGARHTWQGRVVRMEAEVDSDSRMVHVVVAVPRPYVQRGDRPPLLPGTFVDVRISGRTLADTIAVPRHAVHEGGSVWVAEDTTLRVRKVEIARADREIAYVTRGLQDGDLVILTPLDAVTDGMKIRTSDTDTGEEDQGLAESDTLVSLDTGFWIPDSRSLATPSGAWREARSVPISSVQHQASSIKHPASGWERVSV